MSAMKKTRKIALSIFAGIAALPVVLIVLFILFEMIGAAVNHAAGDIQTKKFVSAVRGEGFEIVGTDTFVGNSGNGNHVDLISSVYVRSDRSPDEAKARLNGCKGQVSAGFPDEDDLETAGLSDDSGTLLRIRLFNSAPFSDNIEGH
jgi:hypothetical protein